MIKLLSVWLVWRAIRLIAAAAVVIGALALLEPPVNGHTGAAGSRPARLTELRGATRQLEQQLNRAIEKTFKPWANSRCRMGPWDQSISVRECSASALPTRERLPTVSSWFSASTWLAKTRCT